MLGFLIFGPILEGVLTTTSILEGVPKVEASSSRPFNKKEREEKEKEEGEIFEVSDSEDDFKVFNRPLSLIEESQVQKASPILDNIGMQ